MRISAGKNPLLTRAARLLPAALLVLAVLVLEYVFFGLGSANLQVPFFYRGDGLSGLAAAYGYRCLCALL